ncbi:phosphoribosyltransferase domain-containing protein [Polaribacter marinivivus]|jgi:pyrimidine operon attenuation protein/uracil phosphoribosyltransferase|uniref:phosphoribosyltransferase domain-containing protein n=1 Tax=Polaribacter TaxID=52959 RepID=UPI00261D7E1A|nr:phosphoribosyltransferase family protein [uncultured Polaribacter sp.]
MILEENIILNNTQIDQKIRRIAYQIYESNSNEKELIIAGIKGNGFILANKIVAVLEKISTLKVTICEVNINKKKPLEKITTSLTKEAYKNKSLVLVDDVLNSGTTLIYGVKHFLEVPLKRFKTAVLVNRNHKKYPVKADFKGVSLSTSIKEHIVVDFDATKTMAYLE